MFGIARYCMFRRCQIEMFCKLPWVVFLGSVKWVQKWVNKFASWKLSPYKFQPFPPDFLVRKFSVNGQFPHWEIRWKSWYFTWCVAPVLSWEFCEFPELFSHKTAFWKKTSEWGNKSMMKVSHTRKSYLSYWNRYAINEGKTLAEKWQNYRDNRWNILRFFNCKTVYTKKRNKERRTWVKES